MYEYLKRVVVTANNVTTFMFILGHQKEYQMNKLKHQAHLAVMIKHQSLTLVLKVE